MYRITIICEDVVPLFFDKERRQPQRHGGRRPSNDRQASGDCAGGERGSLPAVLRNEANFPVPVNGRIAGNDNGLRWARWRRMNWLRSTGLGSFRASGLVCARVLQCKKRS